MEQVRMLGPNSNKLLSADPRQLFAAQHVHNPAGSDGRYHGDQAGMFITHAANADGAPAAVIGFQDIERAGGIAIREKNGKPALVCHVKRGQVLKRDKIE